jgi:hypothetical protein
MVNQVALRDNAQSAHATLVMPTVI